MIVNLRLSLEATRYQITTKDNRSNCKSIQQFWSLRQYIIISHYLYDVDYALLIFKVNEDSRVQFDSMGAKYVLSSKLVGTELRIYSNHVNSRKLFILF